MILDQTTKIESYSSLGERIAKAISYIKTTNLVETEVGKYAIDGTDVFAIISEYQSKPVEDCKPETHKNYIDIQMVISGEELIGYSALTNQTPSIEYNSEKDVTFYNEECTKLKLVPGLFAMFFPQDIHQPSIMVDQPTTVKKLVVKIKA